MLEALAIVRQQYPDTEIAVTGRSFLAGDIKSLARQNGYEKYLRHLVKRNRLDGAVHFLGHLSAQDMKQAYLEANVFVLCSTMENSPNALGEAMLLGLPCVAAEVGGVSSLIGSQEGILCAPVNPAAMAEGICRVFSMEDQAEAMGAAARNRARKTHDPEKNMKDLMDIYRLLSGKER